MLAGCKHDGLGAGYLIPGCYHWWWVGVWTSRAYSGPYCTSIWHILVQYGPVVAQTISSYTYYIRHLIARAISCFLSVQNIIYSPSNSLLYCRWYHVIYKTVVTLVTYMSDSNKPTGIFANNKKSLTEKLTHKLQLPTSQGYVYLWK